MVLVLLKGFPAMVPLANCKLAYDSPTPTNSERKVVNPNIIRLMATSGDDKLIYGLRFQKRARSVN